MRLWSQFRRLTSAIKASSSDKLIVLQLPHTLLSRFDLIFLILDPQDEVYDARLARHLVGLYYKGTSTGTSRTAGLTSNTMSSAMDLDEEDPVYHGDSAAMLRDYIAYAKVHPILEYFIFRQSLVIYLLISSRLCTNRKSVKRRENTWCVST